MQRILHDISYRTDFGDTAGIHHGDAVRGLGDHPHVVGHEHDGSAVIAPETFDQ
ncbi:hypothetical protein GALL_529240 [mine drainage metagenome]|uniref:Uncharacterized protein n=1 Tax=mine drainage metagenome TaxID=410659 RepID=A0A1J5P2Z4_9ZZZZ